jgi:hypothetical protein
MVGAAPPMPRLSQEASQSSAAMPARAMVLPVLSRQ